MNKESGIYGVVLASGLSTRMGTPKLLLEWKGLSLLAHILDKTTSIPFQDVKVVIPSQLGNYKEILSRYDCSIVPNTSPQNGLGHSLSLAILSLPSTAKAAIILLGDQPTLAADDLRKVFNTFSQMSENLEYCPRAIVQIKYQNGKTGHPVLFSYHFFDELSSLCRDKGGKAIIRKNSDFVFVCPSGNTYPNDIDTPEDYNLLLKGEMK